MKEEYSQEAIAAANTFGDLRNLAKNSIISTVKIEENWCKGFLIEYWNDIVHNRIDIHLSFNINGQAHRASSYIDLRKERKEMGYDRESEVKKIVREKFAQIIADYFVTISQDLELGLKKEIFR